MEKIKMTNDEFNEKLMHMMESYDRADYDNRAVVMWEYLYDLLSNEHKRMLAEIERIRRLLDDVYHEAITQDAFEDEIGMSLLDAVKAELSKDGDK
jgi:molecular chaperone GrpE (heat shock protein)